ncbi:hypothetical protein ORV05_07835 [Amycolatopsis cynarae]|uniref:Ankyrin repeat domain-containing protein n=1 Tax=Amycolatopsis cynarae TaxID=2995223 RepID=A0ABY7B5V2_9PSEU|nr:hypothetical protein [Amycolatopsis sp. HUAS 11-8]WAL67680.1 hypothetical protein ORV05_07835 [Amycolatopsis sp. HUAS 11-8]
MSDNSDFDPNLGLPIHELPNGAKIYGTAGHPAYSPEAIEILKRQGVDAWHEWCREHALEIELHKMNLVSAATESSADETTGRRDDDSGQEDHDAGDRDDEAIEYVVWAGGGRGDYYPEAVEQRDRLAHAAHTGDWDTVLDILRTDKEWVNASRLGSQSGYAPLHQAAWHGAGEEIVQELLDLGAWRTLKAANGATPLDVALKHGHNHLAHLLTVDRSQFPPAGVLTDIQTFLWALITVRTRGLERTEPLTLPQLDPLFEAPNRGLWFPVPGMYGGFRLRWHNQTLISESWCRVVGGSERVHRITQEGIELLAAG